MLKNTQQNKDYEVVMVKPAIIDLARQFSFSVKFEKPNNLLVRFHREIEGTDDYVMIDVWYSGKPHKKMTVGVYKKDLETPDRSAFEHHVSKERLVEIFSNPNIILK